MRSFPNWDRDVAPAVGLVRLYAVSIDPAPFSELDGIENDKGINLFQEREISQIGEKVGLHNAAALRGCQNPLSSSPCGVLLAFARMSSGLTFILEEIVIGILVKALVLMI